MFMRIPAWLSCIYIYALSAAKASTLAHLSIDLSIDMDMRSECLCAATNVMLLSVEQILPAFRYRAIFTYLLFIRTTAHTYANLSSDILLSFHVRVKSLIILPRCCSYGRARLTLLRSSLHRTSVVDGATMEC